MKKLSIQDERACKGGRSPEEGLNRQEGDLPDLKWYIGNQEVK